MSKETVSQEGAGQQVETKWARRKRVAIGLIEGARLELFELSIASAMAPAAAAILFGVFDWPIFILQLVIGRLLGAVSCWANEIGDLDKGVDNDQALGPVRALRRGDVTKQQLIITCIVATFIAIAAAILLLLRAYRRAPGYLVEALVLIALLGASIWAAYAYTMGDKPYGYHGLGDWLSFAFYGIVEGVFGFYLYGPHIVTVPQILSVLLIAISIGGLWMSTMNLGNLRDWKNDLACGKFTTAIQMGYENAIRYQYILFAASMVGFLAFALVWQLPHWYNYLFVLSYIPLVVDMVKFKRVCQAQKAPEDAEQFGPLVLLVGREMGIMTLAFLIFINL